MNLKAKHERFPVFTGAKPDIERIEVIWEDCLERYGGPFLFGKAPTVADAMYAPVATRFLTYDVPVSAPCAAYCDTIMSWEPMKRWVKEALAEPEELEELDIEF